MTLQKKLGAFVGTPEMMIVELNLTPEVVRVIETENAVRFSWFAPTYAALARHGLLPDRKIAWDDWLKQYRAKKAGVRTLAAQGKTKKQWKTNRGGHRADS